MKTNDILAILLGAILLTIVSWGVNYFLGTQHQIDSSLLWSLLANLFISILFFLLIRNSVLQKKHLVLYVLTIFFAIGYFNTLIEAFVFDVASGTETIKEMTRGFLLGTLFSCIAIFIYKQKEIAPLQLESRSSIKWLWKILLGNCLYAFLYLVAGGILVTVYPQLLEFYEGKIPPLPLVIKTQLFLRGFIFIGVGLLILRTVNLPLIWRACLVGLTFSILGGIAPLIQPNELMPRNIRLGHLFEVGISNFVYGLLLGYLIGQRRSVNEVSSIKN